MDFILIGSLILAAFWAGSHWQKRRSPDTAIVQSDRTSQIDTQTTAEESPMPVGERLFSIMFIGGWLIAWSFGILMVTGILLSGGAGGASIFLIGWLIAAIAGWFAAVHTLVSAIRGKRGSLMRRR